MNPVTTHDNENNLYGIDDVSKENFIESLPDVFKNAFAGLPTMRINSGIEQYGEIDDASFHYRGNDATVVGTLAQHKAHESNIDDLELQMIRINFQSPTLGKGVLVIDKHTDTTCSVTIESRAEPIYLSRMEYPQDPAEVCAEIFPNKALTIQNDARKRISEVTGKETVPGIIIDLISDGRLRINEQRSHGRKLGLDMVDPTHGEFNIMAEDSATGSDVVMRVYPTSDEIGLSSEQFMGVLNILKNAQTKDMDNDFWLKIVRDIRAEQSE